MNGNVSIGFIVIAALVVFGIIVLVLIYNSLIAKRNNVDNAFATIDTLLKKRCDLIPNLVATVKTYMQHENSTLTKVAELRARAIDPNTPAAEKMTLQNEISSSLRSIMVSVESYPDLKATENFQMLQRSLNEIEEQLSAARRSFNANVTDFNTSIQIFPYSILAGMMGFTKRELFAATEAERENPNVANLFK